MTLRKAGTILLGLLCGTAGCENDATVLLAPITAATLFAGNTYSPPGSSLQSICFLSGTLPFTHWPPQTQAFTIPLSAGREFRPVTAPAVTRDSLLPQITVQFTRIDAAHFSLAFGPPLSDTVTGTLDGEGAPVRVLDWSCPVGLPFRTDTVLLEAGYVADSAGPGYLLIQRVGAP